MTLALIQAAGIGKVFHTAKGKKVPAVTGVDLNIQGGEIYGLVGSDSAGKTTTLRLLVGALKLDTGSVSIAGFDIQRQTEQARAQIGYLSQRFSLYDDLTVLENIRFFAEVRGLSPETWRPRCMKILDFVGLLAFKDRRAGQLSGGMRQKLGLASALVTQPRVLLLDEPTTGVDPLTRQDFWQLILQLISTQENGSMCAVISTPYMDEAVRCQRIGFMQQGKIVTEGSPGQLRAALNGRILEITGSPLPLLRQIAAKDPEVEDVHAFGNTLHARLRQPQTRAVIERLQQTAAEAGGMIHQARSIPATLEDVFISLTAKESK